MPIETIFSKVQSNAIASATCWKQKQFILVDYDNTLNQTEHQFAKTLNGLFGITGDKYWTYFWELVHEKIVHQIEDRHHSDLSLHCMLTLNALGVDSSTENVRTLVDAVKCVLYKTVVEPELYEDVTKILTEAYNDGKTIVLTTMLDAQSKCRQLRNDLGNIIDCGFDEMTVGCPKNNPDFIKAIMRELNAKPSDVLCIGDSIPCDCLPPLKAGASAIWIDNHNEERNFVLLSDEWLCNPCIRRF
jgi:FMN phosphatase YigB (HAD superfamily)